MNMRSGVLKRPVVDPLPELPFPLPHKIGASVRRTETRHANTERSCAREDIELGIIALAEGRLNSANKHFQDAFSWPDNSVEISAIDYSAGDKRVRRYGPHVEFRLREHGIDDLFVKTYDDPDVVLRTAYLCKALYWESRRDPSFPLGEELAYTTDKGVPHSVVSISSGLDLALHAEHSLLSRSEELALLDAMRNHTNRLIHYLTRSESSARLIGREPAYLVGVDSIAPLLAQARPEEYCSKSFQSARIIRGHVERAPDARDQDIPPTVSCLQPKADAVLDSAILGMALHADQALFVPHVDCKAQNFALCGQRVRNIDLEKAVAVRVHPAHLFAHAWFSPWRHLTFEERLDGTLRDAAGYGAERSALDAVYYYLQRQAAVAATGVYLPFPEHEELVRRTVRGHLDALVRLAGLPEVSGRYRCAPEWAAVDPQKYLSRLRLIPGWKFQGLRDTGSS